MFKYLDTGRSRKIYRENFFRPLGPQFGLKIMSSMFKYLTPSVCMKIGHITHGETLT